MDDIESIQSLSHLPLPDTIDFEGPEHYKIILPVYCLSFFKSHRWKPSGPAFLVFTDFTPVPHSAIGHNLLSSRIPIDYPLENEYVPLDKFRLFSSSVPAFKCFSVIKEFRSFKNPITNDFLDEDTCKLEGRGIFINLSMTLKTYQGKIESNFNSLTLLSDENIDDLYPVSSPRRRILINLLKNFKFTAKRDIFYEACKVLSIDSIIGLDIKPDISTLRQRSAEDSIERDNRQRVQKRSNGTNLLFQQHTSSEESVQREEPEPPQKVQKRPHGMNLLFQQHISNDDTQRPISLQSQTQNTSQSDFTRSLQRNSQVNANLEEFDQFLVNKIDISQLISMAPKWEDLKKARVFEVDLYVKGVLPMHPFIVKPFKRTLKVAPFKLVVNDDTCGSEIFLEFQTTQEICDFLGVAEEEQILQEYDYISAMFEKIIQNPLKLFTGVKIQSSFDTIRPNLVRPYWTCTTSMQEMLKSKPHRNQS